jgi:hypothetical protein
VVIVVAADDDDVAAVVVGGVAGAAPLRHPYGAVTLNAFTLGVAATTVATAAAPLAKGRVVTPACAIGPVHVVVVVVA